MRYRIFALDIDNTLLQGFDEVSERNRAALWQAEAVGCRVVLCTARGRFTTRPVLARLGAISGPHIIFNGAARLRGLDDTLEEVLLLDRQVLRDCLKAVLEIGVGLSGFEDPRAGDRVYVNRLTKGLLQWSEMNPQRVVMVDRPVDVIERDLVALLCWGTEDQAKQVCRLLGRPVTFSPPRLAPALQFDSYLVELTAAGATKGESLARLVKTLDVPPEAVIAMGDAEPDIGMIEYAGLGVAVQNAQQAVLKAADYIAPSCDKDAVAHVVEQFILG
ncbi:MAG: HAD family hydrolase [Candidatus Zipacnadales bacterium]